MNLISPRTINGKNLKGLMVGPFDLLAPIILVTVLVFQTATLTQARATPNSIVARDVVEINSSAYFIANLESRDSYLEVSPTPDYLMREKSIISGCIVHTQTPVHIRIMRKLPGGEDEEIMNHIINVADANDVSATTPSPPPKSSMTELSGTPDRSFDSTPIVKVKKVVEYVRVPYPSIVVSRVPASNATSNGSVKQVEAQNPPVSKNVVRNPWLYLAVCVFCVCAAAVFIKYENMAWLASVQSKEVEY